LHGHSTVDYRYAPSTQKSSVEMCPMYIVACSSEWLLQTMHVVLLLSSGELFSDFSGIHSNL